MAAAAPAAGGGTASLPVDSVNATLPNTNFLANAAGTGSFQCVQVPSASPTTGNIFATGTNLGFAVTGKVMLTCYFDLGFSGSPNGLVQAALWSSNSFGGQDHTHGVTLPTYDTTSGSGGTHLLRVYLTTLYMGVTASSTPLYVCVRNESGVTLSVGGQCHIFGVQLQ